MSVPRNATSAHRVSSRSEANGLGHTATWTYSGCNWNGSGENYTPKLAQGYPEVDVTRPDGAVEKHYFHVLTDLGAGVVIDHLAGRER